MAKVALAVLVAFLALGRPGWAAPVREAISTLFNSGVGSAGTPLRDGTVGDPHYTLSRVPFPSPGGMLALRSDGPAGAGLIGPWAGDDSLSAWISPNSPDLKDGAVGEYYYTTTFDLSGFDPSTALIYGAWSADDVGAAMYLNGRLITILTDLGYGPQNYSGLTTFDYYYRDSLGAVQMVANAPLQDGFLPGINTLTFRVDNIGGPTGLRVEMNASAVPLASVPEPASLALLGTGLAGLLAARRRAASA